MKYLIVFILFFIVLNITQAQNDSLYIDSVSVPRGFIGISFGPSYPFSDYKKTKVSDPSSGFAMTGVHINIIQGAYVIKHNFGVSFLYGAGANNFDASSYVLSYADIDKSSTYIVKATSWSYGTVLGGLFLSFPIDNFMIDFRAMGGYSSATSPRIQLTIDDGINVVQKLQSDAKSGAFAFDLGMGFRFAMNKRITATAYVDYLQANHTFSFDANSIRNDLSIKAPISVLHMSFGFGYLLY